MDLATIAITKLASVQINALTTTKQTLYTVPTGKTFIPVEIVVRFREHLHQWPDLYHQPFQLRYSASEAERPSRG